MVNGGRAKRYLDFAHSVKKGGAKDLLVKSAPNNNPSLSGLSKELSQMKEAEFAVILLGTTPHTPTREEKKKGSKEPHQETFFDKNGCIPDGNLPNALVGSQFYAAAKKVKSLKMVYLNFKEEIFFNENIYKSQLIVSLKKKGLLDLKKETHFGWTRQQGLVPFKKIANKVSEALSLL